MKDPRHVLREGSRTCRRCGGSLRHNSKFCPVGFWASRAQHKLIDGVGTNETIRLERKWLAEWEATQAPSVDTTRKETEK